MAGPDWNDSLRHTVIITVVVLVCGTAHSQDADPYGGAAGFMYSQGRVAAPGQIGSAVPQAFLIGRTGPPASIARGKSGKAFKRR